MSQISDANSYSGMLVLTGEELWDDEVEDKGEDVIVNGALEVERSVDIGVEEAVVLSLTVVGEDDVNVDGWVVVEAIVEGVVGWTELSGVDVVDRSPLLDVAVITDDGEEDIDETFAEVERIADDDTVGLADVGAAGAPTVVMDMVVCEALRVVHAEEPQKLNVNARKWLLRLFRRCRRCYRSRGKWSR